MINIILWIIFGSLAGWIASIIAGTNYKQGALTDIVLGIIGAVVGGFIMQSLGGTGVTGFNLYSLVVSVIGAIILLAIGKLIFHG